MGKYSQLLGLVIELAHVAEQAAPRGKGQAKAAFVIDAANLAYQAEKELRDAWPDKLQFAAVLPGVVNAGVSFLNQSKVFKKEGAAQ